MANNIPNFTPTDDIFNIFNGLIKQYLLNNLFTVELMEIAGINQDNTINIKSILTNLDTSNNPIKNDAIINNINILTIKGGQSSISFNCDIGDIGLYLSLKKDYSKYFKDKTNTITNNILFNISNGVFIPLQLNNISNSLIIKNGQGTIEINNDTINITCTNANINASNINLGGEGGQAVARVGDSIEVNITSGSSAGTWSGTIKAGSSVVKSV